MQSHAMAVMAALLWDLGVLVDREAPPFPSWPPPGLSAERVEAIHEGGDATPEERAAYDAWSRAYEAVAATQSPGGVPTFKLASNDGWIVLPDECRAIAAALRACVVDDAFTRRVNEISESITDAVRRALEASGHSSFAPTSAPTMSQPEVAQWIAGFATWNEVAATVGGYTVT